MVVNFRRSRSPYLFHVHQRSSSCVGDGTAARIAGPARVLALTRAAEQAAAATNGDDSDEAAAPGAPQLARLRLTLAPDGAGRLDLSATTAAVPAEIVFPTIARASALAPVVVPGGLGAHKWADRRLRMPCMELRDQRHDIEAAQRADGTDRQLSANLAGRRCDLVRDTPRGFQGEVGLAHECLAGRGQANLAA